MGGIVAAIIAAVASIGVGITSAITNARSTQETNRLNQQINEDNLEYNSFKTQQQWERDDNAHQREVADLKKAGLSPLANLQGSTNSSAIGAPNPIAMQAPQVDTNALINSINSSASNFEKARSNKENENLEAQRLSNQTESLLNQSKQLDIENKKVEESIQNNIRIMNMQAQQLEELKRSNQSKEELQKYAENNKRMEIYIEKRTRGVPFHKATSLEEEETMNKMRADAFETFLDDLQETSVAYSSTNAGSASANIGASVMGTGGNIGGSGSSSNGYSYSKNESQKIEYMWKKFNEEYPMYLYLGDFE